MKKAKIILAITAGISCLALVTAIVLLNKKPKTQCTVTVTTFYSGFGESGQDLGRGKFSTTFTAQEGDAFEETTSGFWKQSETSTERSIATIETIREDGVTCSYVEDGQTKQIDFTYGRCKRMNSNLQISDGRNYIYQVVFSNDCPAP